MNIAPKQIDEVIESHPAVLEAAVVGVPDRYVGEDFVAFAVLRDGMPVRRERAARLLRKPSRAILRRPTRIHFVRDLPKGPSGKVQRLRLLDECRTSQLPAIAAMYNDGVFCLGSERTAAGDLIEEIDQPKHGRELLQAARS